MRTAATSVFLAGSLLLQAQTPPKPLRIPIEQYKLDNGLRIVMSVDHSAPTYGISITYNVGSHNEHAGRTGFAHLFEHMMFEGSENVGKGEHMILVENNGGNMNGTTTEDRTNYFESFASNQLDLGLFLESDRMRSLAVNQANLDNQRNAVQEERRLSVDNQPYGETSEVLQGLIYDNFANKHSVIGSMQDLNAATIKDVQEFFRIYYAPNNAVLTLVGDFEPADALAKIKKYFGDIPAQPAPPVPDLAEPKQTAERTKTIEDPFAQVPRLDIAFKTPPGNTPDVYALDVLSTALGGGQSSRLYQTLVKDKELAVNVFCYIEEHKGPSTFNVVVLARPGKDLKEVEKAVYAGAGESEIRAHRRLGIAESPHDGAPSNRAGVAEHAVPRLRHRRDGRHLRRSESHQHALREDPERRQGRHPARRESIFDRRQSHGCHHAAQAQGRDGGEGSN